MNKMYLVLGDWSDDGHGKYEKVLVEVNKSVEDVQNAYKASCKLTGISFNHNDDYTEQNRHWEIVEKYQIAVGYEEPQLTEEVLKVLKEFKCPPEIFESYIEESCEQNFIKLWFWFVKLSLPDMEYILPEKGKDLIPCINGYWNKNLNAGFGYGLYE